MLLLVLIGVFPAADLFVRLVAGAAVTWSQLRQGIVGVVAGVIAFGLCAAATASMATWGKTTVGHNQSYPWIGLISMFFVCAAVSALYARSSPQGPAV